MTLDTIVPDTAGLSAEQLRGYLRQMYLIRLFEEQAEQLYIRGLIHGTMHLSIGQEASAVGACAALQPDDYILSTHRGHGHCIAKGARIERMMAEFMGKETGYCRGRGGSMHIADVEGGNLGANGIVAGGIPIATGVGSVFGLFAKRFVTSKGNPIAGWFEQGRTQGKCAKCISCR